MQQGLFLFQHQPDTSEEFVHEAVQRGEPVA